MYIRFVNFLNKLIFYKFHFNCSSIFFVILSINYGWSIISFTDLKLFNFNDSLFLGYLRLYRIKFKILGFGYRWQGIFNGKKRVLPLCIKLWNTHKIIFHLTSNLKCYWKRKVLHIKHRVINYLLTNLKLFYLYYRYFVYFKKGIFLKGIFLKLKINKKKIKF